MLFLEHLKSTNNRLHSENISKNRCLHGRHVITESYKRTGYDPEITSFRKEE